MCNSTAAFCLILILPAKVTTSDRLFLSLISMLVFNRLTRRSLAFSWDFLHVKYGWYLTVSHSGFLLLICPLQSPSMLTFHFQPCKCSMHHLAFKRAVRLPPRVRFFPAICSFMVNYCHSVSAFWNKTYRQYTKSKIRKIELNNFPEEKQHLFN